MPTTPEWSGSISSTEKTQDEGEEEKEVGENYEIKFFKKCVVSPSINLFPNHKFIRKGLIY